MDLAKLLTLDMLEGEQLELAQAIGIDAYVELVKMYGGIYVYVPLLETLVRDLRNQSIREEFGQLNANQLARKWHLSLRRVQQILRENS